jgi:uncharacterized membrane protein YdjX (TVP38/TMEM64 family)
VAAVFVFVLLRALAIVIPPLMGVVFDVAGIAVFGWILGFVYAEAGIMAGAMCAFGLTRYTRGYLERRPRLSPRISAWGRRLSQEPSLSSWILLRLVTNPVFDFLSYAAGLTRMRVLPYAVGTLIGNVPSVLLFYYLGGKGMEGGDIVRLILVASVCLAVIYGLYYWLGRIRTHED